MKQKDSKKEYRIKSLIIWFLILGVFYIFWQMTVTDSLNQVELKYSEFYRILKKS